MTAMDMGVAPPKRYRGLVATLLALVFLLGLAPVRAESTIAITHSSPVSADLDRDTLRAVFSMRLRQWPDGTPVRLFVMPDDDRLHIAFVRERLGTYPYVWRALWDRLVFTGTGFAPTTVRSVEEMRERVRNTPGAIGYDFNTDAKDRRRARVVPLNRDSSNE